jgi:hypothetical protein
MEMKSRYYEKIWHEILDDPKLGPLADSLKWRFVALILAAGQHNRGGELPPLPDLAWRLRVSEEQLRTELPTLAQRELIELMPNGRWFVTNYTKRQAAMSPAERVRRHRAGGSYPQAGASSSSSPLSVLFGEEEDIEEKSIGDNVTDVVTTRYSDVSAADLLRDAGIERNRTTAPLWSLDPDYISAHISAAKTPAQAIRRMLDGDPPPRRRKPAQDYSDVILR